MGLVAAVPERLRSIGYGADDTNMALRGHLK